MAGYRDRAAVDRGAVIDAIVATARLAVDHPAIIGADINPLLSDENGVVALDARIEIDPERIDWPAPNPTLSVLPYPAGWKRAASLAAQEFRIRPIMPADAQLYPRFLAGVTAEDMRLRFLVPTRTLSAETLVRLSQLDYDRDIAFVALNQAGELAGIGRYTADPDGEAAEFGLLVRSDLQGLGLGTVLMQTLISYARANGLKRLVGSVLTENRNMLDIGERIGFRPAPGTTTDDVIEVRLDLERNP